MRTKEELKEVNKRYRDSHKEERKEYDKLYSEANKEKIAKKNKEYREINKEKISKQRKAYRDANKEKLIERSKEYYINNVDKIKSYNKKNNNLIKSTRRKYIKKRLDNDSLFKLTTTIRGNLKNSLRKNGYEKTSRTQEILTISFADFKLYIEEQFEPWMCWENHGKYNGELNYGWDLDHIIPISSAKTEEEMLLLNKFDNFQPLCSKINRDIKKDKLNYE